MSALDNLKGFRKELLRWNDSINLVSRRDTEIRIDALMNQCAGALRAWEDHHGLLGLSSAGRNILYIDIGSGGGFPGVVWHEMLAERADHLRTALVEPREKRAWFLERISRELSFPHPEVHACRWEDLTEPGSSSPDLIIVSLKALRLRDTEILVGLESFLEFGSNVDLVIARFYPAGEAWSEDLFRTLGIMEPQSGISSGDNSGGWRVQTVGAGVLQAVDASLVISRQRYERYRLT